MKRLKISFVFVVSVILATCAPAAQEGKPVFHSAALHVNPDLTGYVNMSVSETTANTVTVTIKNNSGSPIYTDYTGFALNVYDNALNRHTSLSLIGNHDDEFLANVHTWWHVPPVPSVSYVYLTETMINPGESLEFEKDLQNFLHAMSPGLYRIEKIIHVREWRDMTNVFGWWVMENADGFYDAVGFHSVTAEFQWN